MLDLILTGLRPLEEELLRIYNTSFEVNHKSDTSPVTQADICSHLELSKILKPFGYPILSEESTENFDRSTTKTFWVIDPLDGTKDFIQQTGEFSIMIGLVRDGIPIFGIVSVPAKQKIYYAEKGKGAYLIKNNGAPLKLEVSTNKTIRNASFITSRNHFANSMQKFTENNKLRLIKCGSNGVKLGFMAEGMADVFFNPTDKMGLWDICAPQIILEESGGTVSDCHGLPIDYLSSNTKIPFGIAASNTILHKVLTDFTKTL